MGILLGQIVNSKNAWSELLQQRINPALAYKISKYANKIDEYIKDVDQKRVDLISNTWGEKNEDTDQWMVAEKNIVPFVNDLNAVLNSESDLDPMDMSMDTLVNELSKNENNSMVGSTLILIEPFFKKKVAKVEVAEAPTEAIDEVIS